LSRGENGKLMMSIPIAQSASYRRSRIVVNLDEPQDKGGSRAARRAGGNSGGKGRRILLIFLVLLTIVLLGIAAGLYFWWQSYKARPNYSLALVVDAAQRNDMAAFDELVDMDRIVDNFVPQVVEKAGAQSSFGLPGGVMRKQLQAQLVKIAPQVKQRVREEIASQVKEISARAGGKPFFLVALALPFAVDTKEEGDAAQVKATFKDRPIELTMQRSGERWKIVGVKDDVLVTRILENVARDLPASAATPSIPDDLRKKLEKQLPGKLPDIPILTK
jgi:flagellar basal body-associated protein FliL